MSSESVMGGQLVGQKRKLIFKANLFQQARRTVPRQWCEVQIA